MTPLRKTAIVLFVIGLFGLMSSFLVSAQTFEMVPPEAYATEEQKLDPQLDTISTAMMIGAHGVALNGVYAEEVLEIIYKHVPEENHEALKADLQQLNMKTEAMAIVLERILYFAIKERGYENPDLILQQAINEFLVGVSASDTLIQTLADRIVIQEDGKFEVLPAQPESQ